MRDVKRSLVVIGSRLRRLFISSTSYQHQQQGSVLLRRILEGIHWRPKRDAYSQLLRKRLDLLGAVVQGAEIAPLLVHLHPS